MSDGVRPTDQQAPLGDMRPARRSHVVLWISLGVAVVLAVLIAAMASAHSANTTADSPLIGKAAPAISGRVLVGSGSASLAQFSGKWVLVNFSASWCIPCRDETPQLVTFTRQHASGSAAVLGVAYDETDLSSLASFLKSNKATWPVVNDGQAVVDYGVGKIPMSYLVDPAGNVVTTFLGGVTAAGLDAYIAHATQA